MVSEVMLTICLLRTCLIAFSIQLTEPALGVSIKSVHLVAGRLGFSSQSGHTEDFKNNIRSFQALGTSGSEKGFVYVLFVMCVP